MSRSGFFVSRFSARRRRLAISCGSGTESVDPATQAHRDQNSAAVLEVREKLSLERPLTWLFCGEIKTRDDGLSSAATPVAEVGRLVRNYHRRRSDVLIDAFTGDLKPGSLAARCVELTNRFRPDLVVICGDDLGNARDCPGGSQSLENVLIESIRSIRSMGALPICCTPVSFKERDQTSPHVELAVATIRNVALEHDVFLVDGTAIDSATGEATHPQNGVLESQNSVQRVTIEALFRDLLRELEFASQFETPVEDLHVEPDES